MKFVLAGDSIVAPGGGWGDAFSKLLDASIPCVNLALGGRSTKSFRDEGRWQNVLEEQPTHVLIEFGHNDQPGKGEHRETDPATTFPANLRRYINEARAAGITPVLVTSMVRRTFGDDGKIHCTLGPYAEATRSVAAEMDVPLIDLNARSRAFFEPLGPEGVLPYSPIKRDGSIDASHLNPDGGMAMARLVVADLMVVLPQLAPAFERQSEED